MRCGVVCFFTLLGGVALYAGFVARDRLVAELHVLSAALQPHLLEGTAEAAEATLARQRVPIATFETRSERRFFTMPGVPGRAVRNVGAGVDPVEGWRTRALEYRRWLEAEAAREPERVVILADAGDLIFGGCSEEQLLVAYNATVEASGGARVVFGAEFGGYPQNFTWESYRAFEDRRHAVLRAHRLDEAPFDSFADCGLLSGHCPPPPSYAYLNAGFMMGPVARLLRVMVLILEELRHITNYQLSSHRVLVQHPEDITLDYAGALVLNIGHFARSAVGAAGAPDAAGRVLEAAPGDVRNRVLGSSQCFVHGQSISGKLHVGALVWMLRRGPAPGYPLLELLWKLR